MFGLIALGVIAASSISASTILGGAAVVTGTAVGIKKYADYVEEENIQAVARARKRTVAEVQRLNAKAGLEVSDYKESRKADLKEQLEISDMTKEDKKACLSYTPKTLIKK